MKLRKIFYQGLNADDDFSIIEKGQWVNASNIRTFSTDKGATGRVEQINGNTPLFNTLPSGTNKAIGGVADDSKKRIYWFNQNSNGDGIYCYDKVAATTYTVMTSSQVEGGLNFSKYFRVDARIIGDLLLFTDNNNEPRCINVEAGIKRNQSGYMTDQDPYADSIKYNEVTIIQRPPIYPATWAKSTDTDYPNNFINTSYFQFAYRYRYKDNQVSVLSSYSQVVPFNTNTGTENKISITIPVAETIDDRVFGVDLCVKTLNKTYIIKSWGKDSDSAAITAHNAGTALSFDFYNDIQGEFLDDVYAARSFDLVPLKSKTIEIADDRNFLANNVLGYDTPSKTSLAVTVGTFDTGGAGTYTSQWKRMTMYYYNNSDSSKTPIQKYIYYVYNASLSTTSYYYEAYKDTSSPPISVNASDATDSWNTEINLAYFLIRNNKGLDAGQTWLYSPAPTFFDTGFTTNLIVSSGVPDNVQFFKSNSTYKVSIAFYDRFRRKCGILKDYKSVTIPVRTFNQSVFSSIINWTLSNTDVTEIPDWAYYYQIHITKNQTTRFFFQINSINSAYVTRNADLSYTYHQTTWADNVNYATSFDLTQLQANGIGYSFTEGDLLILYKTDGTNVTVPIIGTDGANVLVKPTDIGDLTGTVMNVIEIYTPYKASETETYYETGPVFTITDPATSSRTYSVLSGQINGDCYAIERSKSTGNNYYCETMSPNDKVWSVWITDTGWPNTIDIIGQQTLPDNIVFSDTYIQGTKTNGLNVFQPLNVKDLSSENGTIQKLQLANKVQADGSVMLAICEIECVSMYLGEQELFDTQGSAFVSQATNVIGTTKALRGSLGTSNPESVFEYNGQVYWWNTLNGCAVQYSDNGLFRLSDKKFVRPSKLFSDKFSSLSTADIEALGSDAQIIGGFDPYHREILFSIPSTEATPPKGFLSDFPSVVYPYDIYDGKGKTLIYKHDADMWFGSMSFETELFIKMDNDLYSFKNGLYIHNTGTPCNFYGNQYTASIMYSNNPGFIHTYLSIGLESNKIPSWTHFRTEDPTIQSSDLPTSVYVNRQGVLESSIYRDRLSPNTAGDYSKKQVSGDKLKGKALLTTLQYEFVTDTSKLELRAVDLGFITNTGTLLNG